MNRKILSAIAALVVGIALCGALATPANAEIREYPRDVDNRLYISEMDQDFVRIYAPADVGHKQSDFDEMYSIARWACQLYNRTATPPGGVSYIFDDASGGAFYLYACAIP